MTVAAWTALLLLTGTPVEEARALPIAVPVAAEAAQATPVRADLDLTPTAPAPVVVPTIYPISLVQNDPAGSPVDTAAAPPRAGQGPQSTDVVVTGRRIGTTPGDPLEGVNMQSFELTRQVDEAVFAPVALGYKRIIPAPIRSGVRNVLRNIDQPVIFLNYLLQLKPGKAAETFGRFAINSTIGAAGLFDVARKRPFNLPHRVNGLANTLGFYGVKPGPFFYLPFYGPTTLRDLFGFTADRLVLPLAVGTPFNTLVYSVPTTALRSIDRRAEVDEQIQDLRSAGNPYAASREFYLERRQAEIDALRGRRAPTAQDAPAVPN